MTTFNAFTDPCIPTITTDGSSVVLSIRDLLVRAHELARFGDELTPLDRDSLYRFFICLAAMVVREVGEDPPDQFPAHAVDAFGAKYRHRFALEGPQPFLQRWDRTSEDIEKLRDPKRGLTGVLIPIEQMHPHVPGASSSRWAIRRDDRDAAHLGTLVILLITAWFQTKNGNGKDPWKGPVLKGSAGTWHVNPMAVYWSNPDNLAETLLANLPAIWVDDHAGDEPLFLNHYSDGLPASFTTPGHGSLTRFSYAKTLPLLHWEQATPVGYVLGADDSIPVPLLAVDLKESLGMVHSIDHTRLFTSSMKKPDERKPRGSFGAQLSSTEGFERWYRAEIGIQKALDENRTLERFLQVPDQDLPAWNLEVFSETTDGKGTRSWVCWDSLPAAHAIADGATLSVIQTLLAFASQLRRDFQRFGKIASGDSTGAPALIAGQAAFYSALMPVIATFLAAVSSDEEVPLRAHAETVAGLALKQFDTSTDPLITPDRIAHVAKARAGFRRAVNSELKKSFPDDTTPNQEAA